MSLPVHIFPRRDSLDVALGTVTDYDVALAHLR